MTSETQGADGAGTNAAVGISLAESVELIERSIKLAEANSLDRVEMGGHLVHWRAILAQLRATPAPAATPGVPDSLRALSEAATQGRFKAIRSVWGFILVAEEGDPKGCLNSADADFAVAAVNHVRALIAAQPAGQAGDAGAVKRLPRAELEPHITSLILWLMERGGLGQWAADIAAKRLLLSEDSPLCLKLAPNSTRTGAAETVAHLKPCPWEEPHLCCYPKCTCAKDRETDHEIDRILAMSGNELHAELVAEGHDPDALVRQMKQGLDGTLRLAADRDRWRTEAGSWRRVAERLEEEKRSARDSTRTGQREDDGARMLWAGYEIARYGGADPSHLWDQFPDETKRIWRAVYKRSLAARPEAPSDAGWRDISTAPRDGSKFDAWAVDPSTGSMGVRFADVQMRGDGSGFGIVIHQGDAHWEYLERQGPTFPAWKLTHWRRAPTPPSDPAPSGQAEG